MSVPKQNVMTLSDDESEDKENMKYNKMTLHNLKLDDSALDATSKVYGLRKESNYSNALRLAAALQQFNASADDNDSGAVPGPSKRVVKATRKPIKKLSNAPLETAPVATFKPDAKDNIPKIDTRKWNTRKVTLPHTKINLEEDYFKYELPPGIKVTRAFGVPDTKDIDDDAPDAVDDEKLFGKENLTTSTLGSSSAGNASVQLDDSALEATSKVYGLRKESNYSNALRLAAALKQFNASADDNDSDAVPGPSKRVVKATRKPIKKLSNAPLETAPVATFKPDAKDNITKIDTRKWNTRKVTLPHTKINLEEDYFFKYELPPGIKVTRTFGVPDTKYIDDDAPDAVDDEKLFGKENLSTSTLGSSSAGNASVQLDGSALEATSKVYGLRKDSNYSNALRLAAALKQFNASADDNDSGAVPGPSKRVVKATRKPIKKLSNAPLETAPVVTFKPGPLKQSRSKLLDFSAKIDESLFLPMDAKDNIPKVDTRKWNTRKVTLPHTKINLEEDYFFNYELTPGIKITRTFGVPDTKDIDDDAPDAVDDEKLFGKENLTTYTLGSSSAGNANVQLDDSALDATSKVYGLRKDSNYSNALRLAAALKQFNASADDNDSGAVPGPSKRVVKATRKPIKKLSNAPLETAPVVTFKPGPLKQSRSKLLDFSAKIDESLFLPMDAKDNIPKVDTRKWNTRKVTLPHTKINLEEDYFFKYELAPGNKITRTFGVPDTKDIDDDAPDAIDDEKLFGKENLTTYTLGSSSAGNAKVQSVRNACNDSLLEMPTDSEGVTEQFNQDVLRNSNLEKNVIMQQLKKIEEKQMQKKQMPGHPKLQGF